MEKDPRLEIVKQRSYKVVKANEIIQNARYDLTLTELKVLAYIISHIKPDDKEFSEYVFSIPDFCKVCGFDYANGHNYERIKKALKTMRDKSFWLTKEDGSETLIGWINKITVKRGSGKVIVRLDEDMQKYLVSLYSNYTQYTLIYALPMQSRFSIRLYEILKSYQYKNNKFSKSFEITDLKSKLAAPYKNFKDFRHKVLEISTREINLYTDIEISWEPIKEGRTVSEVCFNVTVKKDFDQLDAWYNSEKKLDGQMSLADIEF